MPVNYTNRYNTYRKKLPSGKYDMLIVALVHQNAEMLKYMIGNIERFIKGNYIFVVHYNGEEHIDENELPEWVWLVRNTIQTIHGTVTLMHGLGKAFEFAIDNITFINCMALTAGCVFIREYIVPTKAVVCLDSHQRFFNENVNLLHESPIHIENLGRGSLYLAERGHFTWQYGCRGGLDGDVETQAIMLSRGFNFTKGCQLPGQVFPYGVVKMLAEDLKFLSTRPFPTNYCLDELIISTYSYWVSQASNIQIDKLTVCTNWEKMYEVNDLAYVNMILSNIPDAYAISKVPDNLHHPIRVAYGSLKN
jgi:hypothetical protein